MEKGHLPCLREAMESTHEACFLFARCVLLSGTEAERGIRVYAGCVLGVCWSCDGCAEVHGQEENTHPLQCGTDPPHSPEPSVPASDPT